VPDPGTTWLGIKYAVTDLSPTVAAGMRFLVAMPLLILLCRAKKVPLLLPRHLAWFAAFVTVGYFCVPYLLLNVGERYISSGLTAICFSTESVLIVLMSVPVLRQPLRLAQLTSVGVACAALVALVFRGQEVSTHNAWGVLAVLTAAVMHAVAYVVIKKYGSGIHVLTLNTVPMAVAGLLLTVVGLTTSGTSGVEFTQRALLATVYLGVVASVVGFLAYFWLLQQLSAVTVSFVFVIFPVIAQVFAVAFEHTHFDLGSLVLAAVILGAFASTQLTGRHSSGRVQDTAIDSRRSGWSGSIPTDPQLAQIYAAAARAYPEECCGFVRRGAVRECRNVIDDVDSGDVLDSQRTAETGYAFGAGDLLELAGSIDTDDPVVLIYHSHPDVGAYFSSEDQRHAVIDGDPCYPVEHLVVDATRTGVRGARKFAFSASERRYVPVAVYGSPEPQEGLTPGIAIPPQADLARSTRLS
jgi:drug/metabolite transporter (DMT)-like permease/proteasome lid subunit RPN8/RPN11